MRGRKGGVRRGGWVSVRRGEGKNGVSEGKEGGREEGLSKGKEGKSEGR